MDKIKSDVEEDGYELIRLWHFDESQFDYKLLEHEVEIALNMCIKEALNIHPDINGIAIGTDDGAMTIFPIFTAFDSIDNVDGEELFLFDSWKFWDLDFNLFQVAYRLILSFRSELYSNELVFEKNYDEFCDKFIGTCIKSMNKAKDSINQDKENFIFMVSSTESEMTVENFRILNNDKISERYCECMEEF